MLDNGCYATTGGQPALSQDVDLAAVAAGAGYRWARRCFSAEHATEAMEAWLAAPGPALLDLAVDASEARPGAEGPDDAGGDGAAGPRRPRHLGADGSDHVLPLR